MKRKRNANKCFRVAISGLLMATLVAPQMTISVFASGTGKASSNAQTEAQMSAEAVAQSNRESGLVGFENEYALSDTNNPVSVIVEFVHQPVALVEAIADANGERVSKSTKKLKALEEQDKEEFYEALEGIDYSVKYEYDDVMNCQNPMWMILLLWIAYLQYIRMKRMTMLPRRIMKQILE